MSLSGKGQGKGIPGMHDSMLALGIHHPAASTFPADDHYGQLEAATTSSPGLMVAVVWLVQAARFHCWLCH